MQDRENFMAMLEAVKDLALTQGNRISVDEIKELFSTIAIKEEQFQYIYEYLAANQIRVKGYIQPEKKGDAVQAMEKVTKDEQSLDGVTGQEEGSVLKALKEKEEQLEREETAYINMYLEDLKKIAPLKEGELQTLFSALLQKEEECKVRIMEVFLEKIVEIAKEHQGKGVVVGDLIQEGNIGLLSALEEINLEEPAIKMEQVQSYIEEYIHRTMERMIQENKDDKILENRLVDKVNLINECMQDFAKANAREATLDEIVEMTNIDLEEVAQLTNLIKISTSKG